MMTAAKTEKRTQGKALRLTLLLVIGLSLLAGGLVLSISYGSKAIGVTDIWYGVFSSEKVNTEQLIVWESRLPRTLCAALVGAFLATAGAVMQGITRNPIASPSIMGVNQGAVLAVVLYMSGTAVTAIGGRVAVAFIGASISATLVFFVSLRKSGLDITRLILAGSALGTLFLSLSSVIALLTENSRNLAFWMAGGFGSSTWASFSTLAWVAPVLLAVLALSPKITILNLGDEVAIGLGERPGMIRFLCLVCVVLLTGAATAVGGNIGFVCLTIPHIARLLIGTDHRYVMPVSMVFGSVLMVYSDVLARYLSSPAEVPVGTITSLIGVPVLIWLVRKEKRA